MNTRFLVLISAAFLLGGCSTTEVIYKSPKSTSSMATIIVKRDLEFIQGGMGAYILDAGSDIEPNSYVAVSTAYKKPQALLYFYYADKDSEPVVLTYPKNIIAPTGTNAPELLLEATINEFFFNDDDAADYIARIPYKLFAKGIAARPQHTFNDYVSSWGATTIGRVSNNDIISWKRPPGAARISIIMYPVIASYIRRPILTKNFTFEAGKTYTLELYTEMEAWPVLELIETK